MIPVRAEALIELRACYAQLALELQPLQRRCDARGYCCNFKAAGHRLYVTPLEAVMMSQAGVEPNLEQAASGTCPYLKGSLCGVREHRALGCRIYFCDTTYEDQRNALYEKYLARVREIEARFGIEPGYTNVTEVDFNELAQVPA